MSRLRDFVPTKECPSSDINLVMKQRQRSLIVNFSSLIIGKFLFFLSISLFFLASDFHVNLDKLNFVSQNGET